ncbi:MAG: prolipoprotein diacylglyceryl transferase [Chloroflexi bacterium]|nr:prolipoprotein diacylglyceryl transferase [Chloroflexota bacterium]
MGFAYRALGAMRLARKTMYPELFTIPFIDWPISSFGAALAIAFLAGYWIAIPRMSEEGLDSKDAANMLIWIMLGGVGGAHLYYAVDFSLRGEAEFWTSLFSRGGLVFYGGLIGGALMGYAGCRFYRIPPVAFANACAISLAIGQAIGRIGCLLVGDDYGRATDLPWGIPIDNPVAKYAGSTHFHPMFLYESLLSLIGVVVLLYLARRFASRLRVGDVLLLYFIWYPAERFFLEFLRTDNWKIGDVPTAQIVSTLLVVASVLALVWWRRPRSADLHGALDDYTSARESRSAVRRRRRRLEAEADSASPAGA